MKRRLSDGFGYLPVITLKSAAAYLGISKAHLSNVVKGKVRGVPSLRHTRIGRRILIRREWADNRLDQTTNARFQQVLVSESCQEPTPLTQEG